LIAGIIKFFKFVTRASRTILRAAFARRNAFYYAIIRFAFFSLIAVFFYATRYFKMNPIEYRQPWFKESGDPCDTQVLVVKETPRIYAYGL
jgi:hypothetical protein